MIKSVLYKAPEPTARQPVNLLIGLVMLLGKHKKGGTITHYRPKLIGKKENPHRYHFNLLRPQNATEIWPPLPEESMRANGNRTNMKVTVIRHFHHQKNQEPEEKYDFTVVEGTTSRQRVRLLSLRSTYK